MIHLYRTNEEPNNIEWHTACFSTRELEVCVAVRQTPTARDSTPAGG